MLPCSVGIGGQGLVGVEMSGSLSLHPLLPVQSL
jgi:hypothetical protein